MVVDIRDLISNTSVDSASSVGLLAPSFLQCPGPLAHWNVHNFIHPEARKPPICSGDICLHPTKAIRSIHTGVVARFPR